MNVFGDVRNSKEGCQMDNSPVNLIFIPFYFLKIFINFVIFDNRHMDEL